MPKNNSLLAKAKSHVVKKYNFKNKKDREIRELAIAWMNDEVTLTQASYALGKTAGSGSVYITLLNALKEMWKEQKLKMIIK